MRHLRVLEFDSFVFDLVLGSSRCGRIIAAIIAMLDFRVSSTNDSSCWFSNSMNWIPGLFLLRTMKSGFQLAIFLYMLFVLVSSFQGSKEAVVIDGSDGLGFVALGSTFVSGVAGDVVKRAVLVGLLVELDSSAKFSGVHCMQDNQS